MLPPTKTYYHYCLLILSSFLLFSCVKDVDFNQAEELEIEPSVAVSLLYFDLQASRIGLIPNNDVNRRTVQDTTKLDIFSEPFLEENLEEATLTFEFTNSIPRDFEAEIVLYDDAMTPLDVISIPIDMKLVTHIRHYDLTEIDKLKGMAYMGIELELIPGSPLLTPNSTGELLLKSSGTFFMSIDAD
ncbi:hypothetical protein JM658_04255 [Joostella atrarenae]|uniref:Uncharacterized protein n=1 Tax=Joostella atrarenae TaxID=679257 RepID=A0ABS9J0T3_9FLAO|nr:hypothetical protein [Joostella atrarenae]MCF8714032.1 hypothetical protein [Joostella atrarenae]